jgi:glycerate 2-kinase
MLVKNYSNLISHGNIEGRKTVLRVIEAGLDAANPYPYIKKMMRIENEILYVGSNAYTREREKMMSIKRPLTFDLSKIENIYLLGGGKAVQQMAQAVEDILGDFVTEGQINAKKGEAKLCNRVHVTFAGHPIPDEDSVKGAQRKHRIEQKITNRDLVFYFTSGGGTATLAWPAPGLTLKDIQDVTNLLYFEKGASMPEKNRVLGKLRMPRIGKTIDAPLVYLRSSETPLAGYVYHRPFPSTNAIDILKRYKIWNKVPKSVRAHLKRVHNNTQYDAYQPPPIHSEFYYPHIYQFRVIGPEQMLKAAKKCAEEQGIHSHIISTSLNDVEVQPIAETFANIACEIDRRGEPFKPPCILIIGGELTVSTEKTTGIGGRNQEFVLATVPYISGSSNIIVAAIDADGADGPTNIAGGIVDGYSMFRAEQHGINIFNDLQNHNCSRPLTKLGDTVFTGVLGQNLRSLIIIYVRSKQ